MAIYEQIFIIPERKSTNISNCAINQAAVMDLVDSDKQKNLKTPWPEYENILKSYEGKDVCQLN